MEVVKKTDDYTIYQKRSKRYAVKNAQRKWLTGDEKVAILVNEKLLKVELPKPKEEPPAEDAPAEEAASEEAPAEDTPAEDAPAE